MCLSKFLTGFTRNKYYPGIQYHYNNQLGGNDDGQSGQGRCSGSLIIPLFTCYSKNNH